MRTAEELIRFAERRVRKIFEKRGFVTPMYHYVREDGQQAIFAPPPFCRSKDQMVALARAVFEAERAVACMFVDEAWMYVGDPGVDVHGLLSEHGAVRNIPGRKECVILQAEDEGGEVQGVIDIVRPEGRAAYLGELKTYRPERSEGRMVGLLPRKGAVQ